MSPGSLNKTCIDAKFPKKVLKNFKSQFQKMKNSSYLKNLNLISKTIFQQFKKISYFRRNFRYCINFHSSEQVYLEIFRLFPELSETFYITKVFLVSLNFVDNSKFD